MTVPVIEKLNELSLGSLLTNVIWPVLIPAVVASIRTWNVSVAPGASEVTSPLTKVKPVGSIRFDRVSVPLPSFRTVKVCITPAPPTETLPKSV